MNMSAASEEQLWNIISYDKECPMDLMKTVVNELINRQLFTGYIQYMIKKMPILKYLAEYEDLIQIGYIGVINAINKYKPNLNKTFKSFLYMHIRTEFAHLIQEHHSIKRQSNKDSVSIDKFHYLEDYSFNLDQMVIRREILETGLSKLKEKERKALVYFLQGYKMTEIAKHKVNANHSNVHRLIHKAIKKINPEAEVNLKTSKGA